MPQRVYFQVTKTKLDTEALRIPGVGLFKNAAQSGR